MMAFTYLAILLGGLAGLAVIDHRYRLAWWCDRRRTALTVGVGAAIFAIWDLVGIALGIFYHGGSRYTLPLRLLPQFPLEEVVFLILLCYSTLIITNGARRLWPHI